MSQVMNRRWSGRAAACVGLLATAAAVHGQQLVLHVDDDAPAGGDGMSWATAFRDLQDAVDLAYADAVHNPNQRDRVIKIAGGTYAPGRGGLDRMATFPLLSATVLLGGFAGVGATDPDHLDPDLFVTVLSGDLAGDDQPEFLNRSDNAYHVVTVHAGGSWSNLVGLTIRGGNASGSWPDYYGGGVLVLGHGTGVALTNCLVTDNHAHVAGGGVGAVYGDVAIIRSRVVGNRSTFWGGGVYMKRGFIEGCGMIGNKVLSTDSGRGGGVYIDGGRVQLVNSIFSGNEGQSYGGGVAVVDCVLDVVNCTFSANRAVAGRAIFADGAMEAWVFSSIFAQSGPSLGELSTFWRARFALAGCIVEGDMHHYMLLSGMTFAGMRNKDTSPRFADPLGLDGVPGTPDDDLRLLPGSPAIDDAYLYAPVWPGLVDGLDIDGLPRVHDDPGMFNSGIGGTGALDIGAHEFQSTTCSVDHNGDDEVDVSDIFDFLTDWFSRDLAADFNRDGGFGTSDIVAFLTAWFVGCV